MLHCVKYLLGLTFYKALQRLFPVCRGYAGTVPIVNSRISATFAAQNSRK
jgi:hypothetical protein